MKETEITVQVFGDLTEIKSKLVKNGFNLIKNYILIDHYFSKYSMSALKKMSYKAIMKNSFLVREVKERGSEFQLLYKDKTIDSEGRVVGEEKIQTSLKDTKVIEIFERAGLTMWCKIKNQSFVFSNSDCEFVLQVVDGLGTFIEIEEQKDMKVLTAKQKIFNLVKIANSLGLELGSDYFCKKPYMMLKFNG